MALPPNVFTDVAQELKKNVYPDDGIARLIVPSMLPLSLANSRLKNRLGGISSRRGLFNVL